MNTLLARVSCVRLMHAYSCCFFVESTYLHERYLEAVPEVVCQQQLARLSGRLFG